MLKGALEKLPEEMPHYDTFGGPDSIALPHVSRNCLWIPYPVTKSSSSCHATSIETGDDIGKNPLGFFPTSRLCLGSCTYNLGIYPWII